ncbi:uncharacterized protein LOC129751221 [Uranotaenia lowii]|uniref:uncharacterized protein LOC129751221 n=1 Tax=Uranotaenia lowii TaxID=190385 RepID=UPI00247A0C1D|nr:uncharacterized protein LOC129751221 [Uranotaenia lowii]
MANYGMLVLFSVIVAIGQIQAAGYNTEPQLVEFGTFAAADTTCYIMKIFKGQKSPVILNFNNPSGKVINYIKVEAQNNNRKAGITADITNGAIGQAFVSVRIMEGRGKSTFNGDVFVQMNCLV